MIQQPPRPQEKEGEKQFRATAFWAEPVERLMVSEVPAGAVNLNVDGRRVMGPLQGFGQLWQKTYRVELSGADVTPAEVVKIWKEKFPEFQPPQNRFYPSMVGVKPGEVLLINATVGGMPVYTGVRIIYADEESFTVMTPEGHPAYRSIRHGRCRTGSPSGSFGGSTLKCSTRSGCTLYALDVIGRRPVWRRS